MAAADGTVFLKSHGPVDGYCPSSFRAETFGSLSLICAWRTLHITTWMSPPCPIHIWCDNEGLVKTAQRILRHERIQLGRDEQEADLIYSFADIAHPFRSLISFEWVKGHQDKSAEGLAARLNRKADQLATKALSKAIPMLDITPSPTSVAIPFLRGRPILSKLGWNIRLEYNAEALIERICSRNNWERSFFFSIFWKGLEKSLNAHQTGPRFTLTKFCNDLLPVGRILLRRREKEPCRCLSCESCEVETIEHMFTCTGHSDWREKASKNFRTQLDAWKTDPRLRDLLIEHIFGHFAPQSDPKPPPQLLSTINSDMAAIDWQNLWKGYIPSSVTTFQASFANESAQVKTKQKDTPWGVKLCRLIHNEVLALWKKRNEKRHGREPQENHRLKREKFMVRARKIQETAKKLPSKRDRDLLESETDLSPWPTCRIVAFVDWAEGLAAFCEKESELTSVRDRTSDEVEDPP